jgi:hypothetical protein
MARDRSRTGSKGAVASVSGAPGMAGGDASDGCAGDGDEERALPLIYEQVYTELEQLLDVWQQEAQGGGGAGPLALIGLSRVFALVLRLPCPFLPGDHGGKVRRSVAERESYSSERGVDTGGAGSAGGVRVLGLCVRIMSLCRRERASIMAAGGGDGLQHEFVRRVADLDVLGHAAAGVLQPTPRRRRKKAGIWVGAPFPLVPASRCRLYLPLAHSDGGGWGSARPRCVYALLCVMCVCRSGCMSVCDKRFHSCVRRPAGTLAAAAAHAGSAGALSAPCSRRLSTHVPACPCARFSAARAHTHIHTAQPMHAIVHDIVIVSPPACSMVCHPAACT